MNDHADTLTERIRRTFELCRREVEHELSLTASSGGHNVFSLRGTTNVATTAKPSRNGHSRPRPATEAQIRAIHAIASKANVKLASELDTHFGVDTPQSLTIRQASELIEKLKRQLTDG